MTALLQRFFGSVVVFALPDFRHDVSGKLGLSPYSSKKNSAAMTYNKLHRKSISQIDTR